MPAGRNGVKMKGIFKKNQIIITALALMICAAGYLQFSNPGEDKLTATESDTNLYFDMAKLENDGTEGMTINVGSSLLSELEESDTSNTADVIVSGETSEVAEQEETDENHQVGDAVMVSTTIQNNFTINARLEREQRRAQSKETLMSVIESETIAEEQKQVAIETLVNLTTIAEKENAAELLLEAKGFSDPIVNIMENEVDVVINASSVTDQQIAQIEDIVTRKTGFEPRDITITAAIQED